MSIELTKEEIKSPLWEKLEEHFKAELARARRINDKDKPEEETISLRGGIKVYKSLLKMNPEFKEY